MAMRSGEPDILAVQEANLRFMAGGAIRMSGLKARMEARPRRSPNGFLLQFLGHGRRSTFKSVN